jgi:hypothetical protein
MCCSEVETWAVAAPVGRAHVVRCVVPLAHGDRLFRIAHPAELHDVALWSLTGLSLPSDAAWRPRSPATWCSGTNFGRVVLLVTCAWCMRHSKHDPQ